MYNLAEETFACSADSKARGSGGTIKAWRKHSEKGDEFQLGGLKAGHFTDIFLKK